MENISGTPKGQTTLIQFDSHLLTLSEPSPNHINITFEEFPKRLKHQITNYSLSKVNYKTITASLKKQHPNILQAKLQKNADQLYVLTIKVMYEYLPEIQQTIIFEKRELSQNESKEIGVKSIKGSIRNLKQQVALLANMQVFCSQIGQNNHEEFIKLPHSNNLILWSLHLNKPSNNILKCQMFTYNSATKQRINSKIIPDEGIYLHHNGLEATIQLRFIANHEDKYDQIILSLEGSWKGNSIVALERL